MKKTEKILIGLVIISILMKYLFIPGSGTLYIFSMGVLSSMYFYFGFLLFNDIRLRNIFKREAYQGISTWRIFGGIATGLALSIVFIGMLFKGQHWPGASFNLIVGIVLSLVIGVIVIIKYGKDQSLYYKNILVRISISVLIGIVLVAISERTFVELRFRNHPKYIEAYDELQEDKSNNKLRDKTWIEYNRATMDSIAFEYFMKHDFIPYEEEY
jgi:hypothetical protein